MLALLATITIAVRGPAQAQVATEKTHEGVIDVKTLSKHSIACIDAASCHASPTASDLCAWQPSNSFSDLLIAPIFSGHDIDAVVADLKNDAWIIKPLDEASSRH